VSPILHSGRLDWSKVAPFVAFSAAALALAGEPVPAGATTPSLTVTPGPSSQPYQNSATVALGVGPNSTFRPNSRIEVLECSAPKGILPTSDTSCDGNTAQYGSVLVARDGSFQVPSYTIYALPNRALGEAPDNLPACNATSECVLYAGQDQNDFNQPKTFSSPFSVAPSASSTPTTVPRHIPAAAAGSTSSGGAAVPLAPGVGATPTGGGSSGPASNATATATGGASGGILAFTGIVGLPWLAGVGFVLVLVGAAVSRRLRKAAP
jgi:hypothetical protein